MEAGDNVEVPPSGVGSPATHRWNPTKEQISMLENLYKQGIRTPTTEQIQEITSRLKAYGYIEGKNVFYWFQNHKARQRQKQKQDHNNMANYFNRFLHDHQPSTPFLSPPPPAGSNVVCSRPLYYLPQSDLGFYPHCPKLLLPCGRKRSPRLDKVEKPNPSGVDQSGRLGFQTMPPMGSSNIQETLSLFPLHPTGVLQERITSSFSLGSNSSENSIATTPSSSSETTTCNISYDQQEGAAADQHFFDFFCGKKST